MLSFITSLALAAGSLSDDTSVVAASETRAARLDTPSATLAFSNVDLPWSPGVSAVPESLVNVGKRYQLFEQGPSSPLGLSMSSHFHALGFENGGPEVDFKTLLSRELGPVTLLGSALLARSLGERPDLDYEAAIAVAAAVTPWASVAFETHVRGEAIDELKTDDDYGRPVGITAGFSARARFDGLVLQVLAGWQSPRGLGPEGPLLMATIGYWP